ncbi:MAG: PQQ-binding-like beta-propeller repeat protein [Armatimonadetes bacterium]|nr:PQQ-binding-like beta-propeller repeat protein [Armatimonadota bacterium]
MMFARTISTTLLTGALIASAFAQFEGPAPLAWRWSQPTSASPGGNIASNGDIIFCAVGGRVYAVERESGNTKWRYPSGAPLEVANFRSGVNLSDGLVIANSDDKIVYALDQATGALKWQHIAPEKIIGAPVTVGKFIAIMLGDGSISVLNAADGTPAWENPLRFFGGLMGHLGTYQNLVIVAGANNKLFAVDIISKKVVWQQSVTNIQANFTPVIFNDLLYMCTGDFVTVLNASTGSKRREVNVRDAIGTNPGVSASMMAVVTKSGKVVAMDLNGRPLTKLPVDLGSAPVEDPVVSGNSITVSTQNGSVNQVSVSAGTANWNFIVRPFVPQTDTTKANYIQAAGAGMVSGTSLLMMAKDGSMLCFDKTTGVDLTPPDVKMAFPNAGDQVSGQPPLFLYFKLSDEASGINPATLKFDIDGVPYKYEYNRDGYFTVKFSAATKNVPLQNGRKKLTVEVADWLGNVTTKSFALTIDNGLRPIKVPGADAAGGTGAGGRPGAGGGLGGGPGGIGGGG